MKTSVLKSVLVLTAVAAALMGYRSSSDKASSAAPAHKAGSSSSMPK